MTDYFHDSNQVRYALVKQNEGLALNWLFFPGGPGGDSSYLQGLVDLLELPGNSWLIDLPASGKNCHPSPEDYDFDRWFEIFLPTVARFKNPVIVGHSFGGMFPLLFPELEKKAVGCMILNAAPKLWHEASATYAKQFDLPDISKQADAFAKRPSQETFDQLIDVCMPYYFPKQTLEKGTALFKETLFRFQPAVWWQKKALEINFSAKWVPQTVPTTVIVGSYDCVCPPSLFLEDRRFCRDNIRMHHCKKSGHAGWLESPQTYLEAFEELTGRLALSSSAS